MSALPHGRRAVVLQFVLFHLGWLVAVEGAARGEPWAGAVVFVALLVLHLAWLVPRAERRRELRFVLLATAVGGTLDSLARALGWIVDLPTGTPPWLAPPWILGLWLGFATLPRHSLAWLRGRPLAAVLLGAVGGCLSFHAGTRLSAIACGSAPSATYLFLGIEYGLLVPLLVRLAPGPGARRTPAPPAAPVAE